MQPAAGNDYLALVLNPGNKLDSKKANSWPGEAFSLGICCSSNVLHAPQVRPVDPEELLRIIKRTRHDMAWRYLEYMVCDQKTLQAEHHTELAVLLTNFLTGLMPQPDFRLVRDASSCSLR